MRDLDKKLTSFFGDKFHKRVFLICLVVSLGLIITSFFVPPVAFIVGSILAAVGEIFAFAALGEVGAAIERGHSASISHGNTTISINKDEIQRPEEQYQEEEQEDGTDIS